MTDLTPIKDTNRWRLVLDKASDEELAEVSQIPGIRLTISYRVVIEGYADAIAAASHLLRVGRAPGKPHGVTYTFPPDAPLRGYQKDGVSTLMAIMRYLGNGGALLADDMGLGKTLQAIYTVNQRGGRKLILAPAAALMTWKDELAKWAPRSSTAVLSSTAKAAEWRAAPLAEYVLTSLDYRMVAKAIEMAGFKERYPNSLIIDEAHRFRGRDSLRSNALEELAPLCRMRLALSATPQFNRPRDWWQLLHILFGHRFGSSFAFDMRYCGGVNSRMRGTTNKGATHLDELRARLSYYWVRRETHEVASELPALTRQVRWCDPSPEAIAATAAYRMGIGRDALQQATVATLDGKREEAMELAAEARQFLLLTWMVKDAERFWAELNERGVPCVCIHGGMSVERRHQELLAARAHRKGVVGTLDSMAESLNLQGLARVGIMHAIDRVPLKMAQAEKRLHRLGTVDPIVWYYLAMRETVDVDSVKMVVEKLDHWVTVMGKGKADLLNAFSDYIDGADLEKAEKELMLRLYEEM